MKKILIVEDNDMNIFLLENYLEKYNIELFFAKTCKEFYSLFKNNIFNVDLILMDYQLPDGNGCDLSKYIINENLKIPIIFVSAFIDKCEEIHKLGIDWFLTKPISHKSLTSCINHYFKLEERK